MNLVSALIAEENVMMPLLTAGVPRKPARAKPGRRWGSSSLDTGCGICSGTCPAGRSNAWQSPGPLANDPA